MPAPRIAFAPLLLTATLAAVPLHSMTTAAAAFDPAPQSASDDGPVRLHTETAFGDLVAGSIEQLRIYLGNHTEGPVVIASVTTESPFITIPDADRLADATIRAPRRAGMVRKQAVLIEIAVPDAIGAIEGTITVTFATPDIEPLVIPISATVIEKPVVTTSPPTSVRPTGPSVRATAPRVDRPEVAAANAGHPVITWEKMLLGDMLPEDSHSRELWLINTGTRPARITGFSEDSEYLTVDTDPAGMVIPPSRGMPIRVSMTMPPYEGEIIVPVSIEFDGMPSVEANVAGVVRHAVRRGKFKEPPVVTVPGPIILPDCLPSATQRHAAWFVNRSDAPVTFIGMKPTCACVTPVPQARRTIEPGEAVRFEFTMEAAEYVDKPRRKSMQLLFEDDITCVVGLEVTARTQETLDEQAAAAAHPSN